MKPTTKKAAKKTKEKMTSWGTMTPVKSRPRDVALDEALDVALEGAVDGEVDAAVDAAAVGRLAEAQAAGRALPKPTRATTAMKE